LAVGLIAVVILNTARISIMAVSESQYFFWHMGLGLWIVKGLMLSGMLGLFYFERARGRATKLDRLARSARHLSELVDQLETRGVLSPR